MFFKADVEKINRVIKNKLLHKLERGFNKTWSSLLHMPTRHTHHQVILNQKVYVTKSGQSKKCNQENSLGLKLVVVGKKSTFKIIHIAIAYSYFAIWDCLNLQKNYVTQFLFSVFQVTLINLLLVLIILIMDYSFC